MSHAVHCHECEDYVWPPVAATGSGGRTQYAAHELALQHVRDTGHTDVHVIEGCYYTGDGARPNSFDGETVGPEDVSVPSRSKMAQATAGAARRLRRVADDLEDGDPPEMCARDLRRYADAVESNVPDDEQLAQCPESRDGEHDLHAIDANTDPGEHLETPHLAAKCQECGAVVRCDVDFDGFEAEFIDEWFPEGPEQR